MLRRRGGHLAEMERMVVCRWWLIMSGYTCSSKLTETIYDPSESIVPSNFLKGEGLHLFLAARRNILRFPESIV